ncbi:MAG: mechanosensitive ion channel [Polyangiaceae bacterium]|nr:mechanosensitive ion channel [Polyangiaceae bacterium]
MSLWAALQAELIEAFTLQAVLVVAGALLLVRLAPERDDRRLKGLYALLAMHVLTALLAAVLRRAGAGAYAEVHLAARILFALVGIGALAKVVFGLVLPRARIHVSRILQDLVVGAAIVATTLALASRAGYNVTGLLATSAVVTAVIGLSLQDTLGNTLGGLALQIDDSIHVGDWVKVGDIIGKVVEIRWRYTAVETRNGETALVPNSVLMKSQVIVLGRRAAGPVQWRRTVLFNVDFRHQPSDVICAVTEALNAAMIDNVARDPAPHCIMMGMEESWGRYAARYWLTNLAVDDSTDSAVRTRIFFALRRANIPLSIPAHAVFVTEESHARREQKTQVDLERRMVALSRVELFSCLSEDDRASLAARLRYSPFTRGEVLTRQGAEAHWLYLVVAGEVAVRVSVDGTEREVARMSDGSFFGEMSLMTGEPRSATVVALSDVECYRLDKKAFQEIVQRRPEIAEPIAAILARRRMGLQAAVEDLTAEARQGRLHEAKVDLLAKMRAFLQLGD